MLHAAAKVRHTEGSAPQKLVLFNPVCCTCTIQPSINAQAGTALDLTGMCPLHDLPVPAVPACIFHGTNDTIALYSDVEHYVKRCTDSGSPVTLRTYIGRSHAFHHYDENRADYQDTLNATMAFLLNTP